MKTWLYPSEMRVGDEVFLDGGMGIWGVVTSIEWNRTLVDVGRIHWFGQVWVETIHLFNIVETQFKVKRPGGNEE